MTSEREVGRRPTKGKKPKKPRRTLPGIAAVYTGGRWRWRACITVERRQRVGSLRDTQRAAYLDVEALRLKAPQRGDKPTLLEGLNAAISRKIEQGLEPHSIQGDLRTPARAILRTFVGGALLEDLTVDMLQTWVRRQLAEGLAPSTISKKRLYALDLAFRAAGVPSPVAQVKRSMRQALRPRDVEIPSYTLEELVDLLRRVREWRPVKRRPCERRETDVLLIHLVATTGIRHDELARVQLGDVWIDQSVIVVRPKVRRRTREETIVPELREAMAERLRELAGCPESTPIVPGYGGTPKNQPPWYPQVKYLGAVRERWKLRLGDPRFNLRNLRVGHASALDSLGAPFGVLRDALGHTRTSQETTGYIRAGRRAVIEAKRGLATHLFPPPLAMRVETASAPSGDDGTARGAAPGATAEDSAGPHQP